MLKEYIHSFFSGLFRNPIDYVELYSGPLEHTEDLLEEITYGLLRTQGDITDRTDEPKRVR